MNISVFLPDNKIIKNSGNKFMNIEKFKKAFTKNGVNTRKQETNIYTKE